MELKLHTLPLLATVLRGVGMLQMQLLQLMLE